MAEVEAARRETARQLQIDEDELDYIDEALSETAEPEDAETYTESDEVEGELLNSFRCRKPVYEGDFLYYYRDCNGVFGRIRRSRIIRVSHIGYCGYPLRKWLVLWR